MGNGYTRCHWSPDGAPRLTGLPLSIVGHATAQQEPPARPLGLAPRWKPAIPGLRVRWNPTKYSCGWPRSTGRCSVLASWDREWLLSTATRRYVRLSTTPTWTIGRNFTFLEICSMVQKVRINRYIYIYIYDGSTLPIYIYIYIWWVHPPDLYIYIYIWWVHPPDLYIYIYIWWVHPPDLNIYIYIWWVHPSRFKYIYIYIWWVHPPDLKYIYIYMMGPPSRFIYIYIWWVHPPDLYIYIYIWWVHPPDFIYIYIYMMGPPSRFNLYRPIYIGNIFARNPCANQ